MEDGLKYWSEQSRQKQRERIKQTRPETHKRKPFDPGPLAAALMGFPKVRNW